MVSLARHPPAHTADPGHAPEHRVSAARRAETQGKSRSRRVAARDGALAVVAVDLARGTPRNIALVRHTTVKHRASHGLDGVRHVIGGERVAVDLARVTPRNVALVRHATLKHRASHDLDGVRHVMVHLPSSPLAWK